MRSFLRFLGCLAAFLLLGLPGDAQTTRPADAVYAVIRIPSHGASATVIWTSPGKSLILGCGHAYFLDDHAGERKRMRLDVPTPPDRGAGLQPAGRPAIKLLAVNEDLDLSLVELDDGPLPYVAPVAALGGRPGRLVSCGYDGMRDAGPGTPFTFTAHLWSGFSLVSRDPSVTYTHERPIPGRSGGGLIDIDRGELVGVCQGYELDPPYRGRYVSLAAIHQFLDGRQARPQIQLLAPQCPPGRS